jgi:hypothetical protein
VCPFARFGGPPPLARFPLTPRLNKPRKYTSKATRHGSVGSETDSASFSLDSPSPLPPLPSRLALSLTPERHGTKSSLEMECGRIWPHQTRHHRDATRNDVVLVAYVNERPSPWSRLIITQQKQ